MYAAELHESAASMQLSMQADQIPEAPTSKHEAEIQGLCQEIGCHIVEADVLMHAQGVIAWDCSCICSPTCPC